MEWYQYVAVCFSGAFLSNAIPHFIHGISGDRFPTPFARPPGKGLSSPQINVLWGGLNICAGTVLFKLSHIQTANNIAVAAFVASFILTAYMLANTFVSKHKE